MDITSKLLVATLITLGILATILLIQIGFLLYKHQFIYLPSAVAACEDNGFEYNNYSFYKKNDYITANCFKVVDNEFVDKEIIFEVN